jgi:hypothetical protein
MSEQTLYITEIKELESGGYFVNGTMSVPNDPANRHYQDIQAYIAEGGEVIPYVPPTEQELLEAWRQTADCSRLQAKLALDAAGLLATVEAFIADPATPTVAKLAWTEAYRYSRKSPLFDVLGLELGMTPEQIDDLFKAAQQIEV